MVEQEDVDGIEPKESWFYQWFPWARWSPSSPQKLKECEETFLQKANAPESQGWYVQSGSIGGEKVRIWTRKYATKIANPAVPVVMVHGMAAGLAYYVTNFGPLSKDRDVYALDWPGFARSSRPKFTTTDDSAEHEFIEALECWRHSVGLERFILLGHSFGGYLSASYALRHPDRVAHLMLVDPWGFPERPENFTPRRTFPWWLRGLFHVFKNFNPLASLRLSGPFGVRAIKRMRPDLVAKYSSAFDEPVDGELLVPEYMFHCNAHSPTGETAFHSLMTQFAWAKYPMLPRIRDLDPKLPLSVFYGGDSWMSQIDEETFSQTRKIDPNADSFTRVHVIPHAGHHVYAEQSKIFNTLVLEDMEINKT